MLVNQDIHSGAKGIKMCCEWSFLFFFIFLLFLKQTHQYPQLCEMGISLGSCHRVLTQDLHICWLLQILCLVCQPTSKCLTVSLHEHITFFSHPHFICTDVCIDLTYDKCERLFLNMWVCIIWVCSFMPVHVEARLHFCLYGFWYAVVNVGNSSKQCFLILIGSRINSEWSVSREDMGKSSGTS